MIVGTLGLAFDRCEMDLWGAARTCLECADRDALIRLLDSDDRPVLREAAAQALGQRFKSEQEVPAGSKAICPLLNALGDADRYVRNAAVEAELGRSRYPELADRLIEQLDGSTPEQVGSARAGGWPRWARSGGGLRLRR